MDSLKEALRVLVEGIMGPEVPLGSVPVMENGALHLSPAATIPVPGMDRCAGMIDLRMPNLEGWEVVPESAGAAATRRTCWRQCRSHYMSNLLTRLPRRGPSCVATMVRTIYQQPYLEEVHAQLTE